MLLTACEKGLDEGIADVAPAGQVMLAGMMYLYRKSNDGLGYRVLGAAETAWPTANTTDSYRLRPVAVVSITKE